MDDPICFRHCRHATTSRCAHWVRRASRIRSLKMAYPFTEVMTTVAAIMTTIAAFRAASAARKSSLTSEKMFEHDKFREQNRVLFLKHQSEVEHLQKLIASFSEVIALASREWSDERNQDLDKTIREMQFHVSVLESLNVPISVDISRWERERNSDGQGIPRNVYYTLGNLHAIGIDKDKDFLNRRWKNLKRFRIKCFHR